MITVTTVLILWGQGKKHQYKLLMNWIIENYIAFGHSCILNLKTFYHRMSDDF